MKLSEARPGVYVATCSAHELSVLIAGARMSLDLMEHDPTDSTAEARASLSAVLADFDRALSGLQGREGPAG